MIKKRVNEKTIQYGFASTGNLNERTARIYADHCLLSSNKEMMNDINRIFNFLENPRLGTDYLKDCSVIIPSPDIMRQKIFSLIETEIRNAKNGKPAAITLRQIK